MCFFVQTNHTRKELLFLMFKEINLRNHSSLHKLFYSLEKIKVNCNDSVQLNQLKIYKEFLQYCGKGRFPLVENSIASSYLATVVYLNDSDNRLVDYLTNNLNIADFKIVRYVDDLYIFSNEFDT